MDIFDSWRVALRIRSHRVDRLLFFRFYAANVVEHLNVLSLFEGVRSGRRQLFLDIKVFLESRTDTRCWKDPINGSQSRLAVNEVGRFRCHVFARHHTLLRLLQLLPLLLLSLPL